MPKFLITNIKWDGPCGITSLVVETSGQADLVSDATGWCHLSFDYEEI